MNELLSYVFWGVIALLSMTGFWMWVKLTWEFVTDILSEYKSHYKIQQEKKEGKL